MDDASDETRTFRSMTETCAPQNILAWEEDQVHTFLSSLGFKGYENQIKEHGITGEILVHLDHTALKDVGIHSVGHRLAILKAVYQLKLQHDVPIEEGHWVPPSEHLDQIIIDSPSGVIPPDRMIELLRERDDRIRSLEVSIHRLQEHMTGVRDEVHVISKTLYTKEPPVSLNKLRNAHSPTNASFRMHHARTSSLPQNGDGQGHASPTASPAASPTKPVHHLANDISASLTDDSVHSIGPSKLQHSSSLRRKRSNNALQVPDISSPVPSPLAGSMFLPSSSTSSAEPPTPTALNVMPHSAATTPAHEISQPLDNVAGSTGAGTTVSGLFGDRVASTSSAQSDKTLVNRESSVTSATMDRSSSNSKSSANDKDNPYKNFRVTMDDPCYKVLPAALKKYKVNDDWRQYALFICYGTTERCLSLDEKPLLLFQKLKEADQNPVFMLRHIKDIASPIVAAKAKHAARREKRIKEGKLVTGEGREGRIRDFSRATRLHHPAVLQPIKGGLNSPKAAPDADKDEKQSDSKDGEKQAAGAGYAVAIYPYMADREDEFDVAVGDTFVILNKTKGWWLVHRDSKATEEGDIVRSGWVPQGCLLEVSVAPSSLAPSSSAGAAPILPANIVSVSTPGLALMDYTPRASDEIMLKKDDRLRVFKRYVHWSYVVKEQSGERGWTPSWFVGKVSSSSSSAQSTPTSAATHLGLTSAPLTGSTSGHPLSAVSSIGTGDTTPTSANTNTASASASHE